MTKAAVTKTSDTPGKRQLLIMITTLLVLAAGFAYYFFGYIKVKEANLNEMGFRVLSRLGKNIVSKKQNVLRNAKNVIRVELKKDSELTIQEVNANQIAKGANKDISFISLQDTEEGMVYPVITGYPGIINVLDSVHAKDLTVAFSYSVDMDEFLTPIIKNDLFHEFVIFSDENPLFSTIQSGFELREVDSLLDVRLGMQVSSIKQIDIGGISYEFFLQPHKIDKNNTWIVAGLIRTSDFNSARMGVSPVIIMFILLIVGLTILSIPFLKLKLMSPMEKLNVSDAVFASISLVLGTSIAVILMLHSYRLGGPDTAEEQIALENFADQVLFEFTSEVKNSYLQLKEFDKLKESFSDNDIVNISQQGGTATENGQLRELAAPTYPLFDQAFWVDGSGAQQVKWSTRSTTTNKINIAQRNYFKNNLDNNAWYLNSYRFSLESIYSWNTGKSMVGVGTESELKNQGSEVVALSSIFYSVIDPIVPQGYGFALVDPEGNVWFHSDKERNLQENFIEESERNPKLRSAIYANVDSHVDIKYHGDDYIAFVSPVTGIPLYLISFHNQSYDKTTKAQTLNFSLLYVFLFFLFMTLLIILSRITFSKSNEKKKQALFGWIWPLDSNKKTYREVMLLNLTISILLFILASITNDEEAITLLYISSMCCFVYTFTMLNYGKFSRDLIRKNILLYLTTGVILVYFIITSLIEGNWIILVFLMVLLGVILLVRKFSHIHSKDFQVSYSRMLLSWLILSSIIPSILFYKMSYNQEHELAVKHSQLFMAKNIAENTNVWDLPKRTAFLSDSPDDMSSRGDMYGKHLYDSIYFINSEKVDSNATAEDFISIYKVITNLVRPYYNDIVVENNDLVFDQSTSSDWYWDHTEGLKLIFSNHKLKGNGRADKKLVILSSVPRFKMPTMFGANQDDSFYKYSWINPMDLIFWIALFSIIVGIYYLLKFMVKNIFVPHREVSFNEFDEKFFSHDSKRFNIFLIGMPNSGKSKFIEEKFPSNSKKLTINLINVYYDNSWEAIQKKALDPEIEIIHVTQFEYNLKNRELTQRKLELLERLLLFEDKKVIVTTTVHINNIEDLYVEDGVIDQADKEALFRWNELFNNFYEVYYPLQGLRRKPVETYNFQHQPAIVNELLENEFNHGLYLEELRPEIVRVVEINEEKEVATDYNQLVMKIQGLCSVYYHSLWSTCTDSEKYIMYDLAEDGLVNSKNYQVIELLMKKGLIVHDGWLKVMNQSFRNFILTKIGPVEVEQIESAMKTSGSWSSLRNPLIIIVLALGAFIFSTQQDSLNSIISFLAPFLAVVPVAFRIISFTNKKKAKTADVLDDD